MKKISRVMEVISGLFFLACGGYVIANILIRTFFNTPLKGVYEMTGLFAIVFAASSIVICIIDDGHVAVDVIVNRLRPKGKLAMKYLSHIIDLLYYAVLAWGAWTVGIPKLIGNELTTTVKFPIGPFRVYWAIAATIIVFVKIIKVVRAKRDVLGKRENGDGNGMHEQSGEDGI